MPGKRDFGAQRRRPNYDRKCDAEHDRDAAVRLAPKSSISSGGSDILVSACAIRVLYRSCVYTSIGG